MSELRGSGSSAQWGTESSLCPSLGSNNQKWRNKKTICCIHSVWRLMKTLMLFRVHCYLCVQPTIIHINSNTLMLDAVSTLIWFHGCHQACLKRMPVKLTKGNVSHCTFLSQNKPILLLFHANKKLVCFLPDRFDAKKKVTRICCHPHHTSISINPLSASSIQLHRPSVCLSLFL